MIRLQMEITKEQVEEIDRISKICGFRTKKELFNNAITLLVWADKQQEMGRAIVSGTRELEMPFFMNIERTV